MTQNLRIQDLDCRVDAHREAGAHLRLITFRPQGDQALTARAWLPGQFVMIDPPTPTFLLRRPMSVMRVHDDGRFDVFYKVHGKGTALMARLAPGDAVRVLGPLGRHFTIETPSSGQPESAPRTLLVGGGIGIAPLAMLADALAQAGHPTPLCCYGVRGAAEIGVLEELQARFGPDRLLIATDDGSYGFSGNVCDLLQAHATRLDGITRAAICGPTPMMRAVSAWLSAFNPAIAQEVSLEIMMPCGTGACGGCVTFRRDGALPVKTCLEGPVFDPKDILWPGETASCTVETRAATCGDLL